MKRLKDKSKRLVKYWFVSYKQASGSERLQVGMFLMMMLVYIWWAMLSF
jgi:hypothetical protein